MARAQRPGPGRPPTRRAVPSSPPAEPDAERSTPVALAAVRKLFAAETPEFFLLLGTTIFLLVFGLVMVLSSSSIESSVDGEGFFGRFIRQGFSAILGIPLMLVASRMPPRFWKRWAWPALLVGGALQLIVFIPGLGLEHGGNQNWISIGGFNMQPSEFVKIALIVWIAWVLSTKEELLGDWRHVALPIAPVAGVAILFVLIGKDLGTASIIVMIVLGCLYFAGVRLKFLAVALAGVSLLVIIMALATPSRTERISVWLNGCTAADYSNLCWQVQHASWALAAGGLFGSGLGNSKAKWNWLPEADNDFIFAIIGEELGLPGTFVILALFALLASACYRIVTRSTDQFVRIAAAGAMAWILFQAMINIGAVIGLLPVIGVPLPFVSAGGSALVTTLVAMGMLVSFARAEPGAAEILAARPGVIQRSLAVLPRRRAR